ncbi:MAG: RNA polymerase-binding protein DksA [Steroidobacteraceae bacterium]|jgi:DnaK suppressor protein
MAAKKPASKNRKSAKPAARPIARKASVHRAEPRKPAVTTRKASGSKEPKKAVVVPLPIESKKPAAKPAAPAAAAKSAAIAKPASVGKPAAVAKPTAVGKPAIAVRVLPRIEVEEGEHEPGSLLAGPRNVKPYVAKRGEQYMGKAQLSHFQQILSSWKQDLMEEVDRTVTHMKDEAANFPDPNDRATQEEEFSLELRTRDRERKLIRKIEEALKRIEDGSYGYCLETGEEIGIKRLEARPVATLSIEAQERRERRERQYGERDDRYR